MMGADGYICKISAYEEIIQGIETVMSGKEYYGSNIQQILFYNTLSLAHQDTTHSFHSLSHQEQKVVQFIALKKLSLSEIAVCMNVSVNTVKSYHRRALKKLNLENITELREYFKVVDNPPNFPSL